jgi:hypothetical protein
MQSRVTCTSIRFSKKVTVVTDPRTAADMRCFNCATPYGGVHPAHARLVADGVVAPCEAEAAAPDSEALRSVLALIADLRSEQMERADGERQLDAALADLRRTRAALRRLLDERDRLEAALREARLELTQDVDPDAIIVAIDAALSRSHD